MFIRQLYEKQKPISPARLEHSYRWRQLKSASSDLRVNGPRLGVFSVNAVTLGWTSSSSRRRDQNVVAVPQMLTLVDNLTSETMPLIHQLFLKSQITKHI